MYIMCKNMTNAMKANKLLFNNGIDSRVEKIKNAENISGCVYSVVFLDKYEQDVLRILKNGNVILHKNERRRYWDESDNLL